MTGSLFDSVADAYDVGRPSYPGALFSALESLAGRRLAGSDVLDVGSGTGIAMRELAGHGARVAGLELGAQMAARLRARDPQAAVVIADGNALPIRDGTVDLVTYAQSWHWLSPGRSIREAMRVLRPYGAAAAWWNLPEEGTSWVREQEQRLSAACSTYHGYRELPVADTMRDCGLRTRTQAVHWTWRVSLETFLASLRSRSYMASLEPAAADVVVEQERTHLSALFPDGQVVYPMRVFLAVGRKEGA